jgi:polysaccharide deacetylase 2 family uncharacterized protein YibQ
MPARIADFLAGWRGLGRFWMIVLASLAVGAGVLQLLGPSALLHVRKVPSAGTAEQQRTVQPEPDGKAPVADTPATAQKPGRSAPGPLGGPDPSLLDSDGLPRIGADGRTPMKAYASAFDPASTQPRVGIVIAGIGLSEADTTATISELPPAVTLAVSPYAGGADRLLAAARAAGHEYLLSIPMEPQGYPINDPDDRHALMASLPPDENLTRLRWVLSRIGGYVGVTSALGPMRGERLAGDREQLESVLKELARRGLLFVDARPGHAALPLAWNRSVDAVIDDDPLNEAALDARLDALSKLARDKGSALGLVSVPRPKTLERVAAWSNTLTAKGLILAPVSALVQSPGTQDQDK